MGHPEADGVRWFVQLPSAGEAAAGREWLCAPWQVAPVWIPSGGEREGVPIQAAFRVEGDAALVLVQWPEAIAAPGESSGVGTLRVGGVDERASGGCVCGVALWMNGGEEASRALVARAPRIGSAMVQVRAFRLPRAHQLLACSWADAVATGHANVSEDHLRGAADPSNGATLLDLQMVCAETTDHTTDSRRDPLQCRLVTTAGLVYTLPMLWETIDASTVLSQIPPRQVPSSSRSARHLPHLQPLCPGDQVVLLRGLDTLVSLPSGRPFSLSSVRADAQVIDVMTMNSTEGAPPCWLIGYADGAIAVVEATLDAEDAISLRALAWHHVPLPYRLIARPVGRQVAESQFADGPGVATAAPLPFLVQWRRQVHRVEFHRQQQQQQHTFTEHTVLGGDVRSLSFLDADTALVEWADEGDTDTFVAAVDADALLQAPRSDADHSDRFQPADVERLLDAVSEASTVWERSVHSDAAALNEAAAELNTALHYAALWAMRGGDKGAVAEPLSEWIAVHVRVQPALHETDTVRLCLSVSLRAERQDATKHPAAPPLSAHWSVMVSASAGACTCSPEHHGAHGGAAGNVSNSAHRVYSFPLGPLSAGAERTFGIDLPRACLAPLSLKMFLVYAADVGVDRDGRRHRADEMWMPPGEKCSGGPQLWLPLASRTLDVLDGAQRLPGGHHLIADERQQRTSTLTSGGSAARCPPPHGQLAVHHLPDAVLREVFGPPTPDATTMLKASGAWETVCGSRFELRAECPARDESTAPPSWTVSIRGPLDVLPLVRQALIRRSHSHIQDATGFAGSSPTCILPDGTAYRDPVSAQRLAQWAARLSADACPADSLAGMRTAAQRFPEVCQAYLTLMR
ncbi:hypothetical protein CDCA_CDCA03G0983 [Cyanidium caldarium]|uniref:Transcription initiation factor TFIID subunit 2 n=1 Tax=Cyanidium caldarium TaxID=2771 RepID=A0AAV9IRS9_CYACA|nr:hypothetical protein CDCA_CDCA03G0983 [Cyanidium caldarium]